MFKLFDLNKNSDEFDTLILISIASLGVAFLANALLTAMVLLRERRQPDFAKVCCR